MASNKAITLLRDALEGTLLNAAGTRDDDGLEHFLYSEANTRQKVGMVRKALELLKAAPQPESEEPLYVILAAPPGPGNEAFLIEVETEDGKGVSIPSGHRGEYWALGPLYRKPPQPDTGAVYERDAFELGMQLQQMIGGSCYDGRDVQRILTAPEFQAYGVDYNAVDGQAGKGAAIGQAKRAILTALKARALLDQEK